MTVSIEPIDPAGLPPSSPAYTHGTEVHGAGRLVFVSGQPPWSVEAPVPADFESQCRLEIEGIAVA
jgi:enamine deaminase RidA (YjgF/YER057c/UK114 family)